MQVTRILTIFTLICLMLSCSADPGRGKSIDDIRNGNKNNGGREGGEDAFPAAMISAAEVTDLMVEKAKEYREASVLEGHRNGIYVYSGATFDAYVSKPEKLAARVAMLGFKDVYLSPGSSRINNADAGLRRFIASYSKYGIDVYAVALSSLQNLVSASTTISEVERIAKYNETVSSGERFAGIAADLEPHTCHDANKPSGVQYTWNSASNYGKGKDNDQLLRLTLDRLHTAGDVLHSAGLRLAEAIFYNYQIYYDQGQLEYGSTAQFLNDCDFLITMAYLTSKESILSKSEPGLKAAGKNGSVSICVKTRMNSDSGSSIQNLGWKNLLEVARYVNEKASAYPSYRGFDMFTFDGLETMWEWENDKN